MSNSISQQARLISRIATSSNASAILSQLFSIALALGTTKFLAVMLSESSYGLLSLYNVILTLPSLAFFVPLSAGVTRLFPVAKGKGEQQWLFDSFHRMFLTGAIYVLLIGGVASGWLLVYKSSSLAIAMALMTFISILSAYTSAHYGLANVAGKRLSAVWLDILERVLYHAIGLSLLLVMIDDPSTMLWGRLAVSAGFVVICIGLRRTYLSGTGTKIAGTKTDTSTNYRQPIVNYSWPFLVFGGMTWIQGASERWMLEFSCSIESVAQYAILNQIGFHSQSALFGAAYYFILPALFRKAGVLEQGQLDDANKLNDVFIVLLSFIVIVGVFVSWLLAPQIVQLLGSDKYLSVSHYLPGVVLAGGVFNIAQIYASRFMICLRTEQLIIPKVLSAVVGCLLNLLGAIYWGLFGLVLATILTHMLYGSLLIIVWKLMNPLVRDAVPVVPN